MQLATIAQVAQERGVELPDNSAEPRSKEVEVESDNPVSVENSGKGESDSQDGGGKFDRTPPKTPEEAREKVSRIVELAKRVKDKVHRAVVGGLTARQKEDFAQQGIDVDDSYIHSVETSAILHNQKNHGNPEREEARGQIAIVEEDYELIPDILENYDSVEKSPNKNGQGHEVIIYTKRYPDGTVYYLEEKRDGRNSLAFETMYKKKKGIDSSDGLVDDNPPPLTPETPSDNLNPAGKGSEKKSDVQEGGAEKDAESHKEDAPQGYKAGDELEVDSPVVGGRSRIRIIKRLDDGRYMIEYDVNGRMQGEVIGEAELAEAVRKAAAAEETAKEEPGNDDVNEEVRAESPQYTDNAAATNGGNGENGGNVRKSEEPGEPSREEKLAAVLARYKAEGAEEEVLEQIRQYLEGNEGKLEEAYGRLFPTGNSPSARSSEGVGVAEGKGERAKENGAADGKAPAEVPAKEEPAKEEPAVVAVEKKEEPGIVDDISTPMPMTGEGADAVPDISRATPARTRHYIFEESGLTNEEANNVVKNSLGEAKDAVKAAKKKVDEFAGKEPDMSKATLKTLNKLREQHEKWETAHTKAVEELRAAEAEQKYWEEVAEEQKVHQAIHVAQSGEGRPGDIIRRMKRLLKDNPQAMGILNDSHPETLEEELVQALCGAKFVWDTNDSRGRRVSGTPIGLKQETGWGKGERRGMGFMFAGKEKGGKTLQAWVEDFCSDSEYCDLSQTSEIRDMVLDLLQDYGSQTALVDYRDQIKLDRIKREFASLGIDPADKHYEAEYAAWIEDMKADGKLGENPTQEEIDALMKAESERERAAAGAVETDESLNDVLDEQNGVPLDTTPPADDYVPFNDGAKREPASREGDGARRDGESGEARALRVKAAADTARELGEKLGEKVRVITDASEIDETFEPDEKLRGRKRAAKGWYDPATGEVVIVAANHSGADDALATVLHEIVAHKGLKELVGAENWNKFLDNVRGNAGERIAKGIEERFSHEREQRYEGRELTEAQEMELWRIATDEYLAKLAEGTDFANADPGLWRTLKAYLVEWLSRMGLDAKLADKLTDDDLRYLLWRSYNRKVRGAKAAAQEAVLRDAASRSHGVGVAEGKGERAKENGAADDVDENINSAKTNPNINPNYKPKPRRQLLEEMRADLLKTIERASVTLNSDSVWDVASHDWARGTIKMCKEELARVEKELAELSKKEHDNQPQTLFSDPKDVKPIGKGVFGDIYDQFKGKFKEAVSFLHKVKGGDFLGVFHRKGFGDIDLVYGDTGGGWKHITDKHVGKGKSFADENEAAETINDIISTGNISYENGDRIVFKTGNKLVTVRKNWREKGKKIADKNWVLTAYDETSADSESPIAINQRLAGSATGVSGGKGSDNSSDVQAVGEKTAGSGGEVLRDAEEDTGIRFREERDEETLRRLDREPVEVGYRNVVLNEDLTMGSPMASKLGKPKVGRRQTSGFGFRQWERSDENPDLANDRGKIDLIKPDGKSVGGVDYNPYIHIRPTLVNKQFKQAWERPGLVYIRTHYPASELTSGYQAEKAVKSVGKHAWNGGELILSRWDNPQEVVPWSEVAEDWVKEFNGRGVEFDIVPPGLLPELVKRGVEILPPHKGMGQNCRDAYEAFKRGEYNPEGYVTDERIAEINEQLRGGERGGASQYGTAVEGGDNGVRYREKDVLGERATRKVETVEEEGYNYEEGRYYPVTKYRVEGVARTYGSAEAAVEDLRERYPDYHVYIGDDGNVELEAWSNILPEGVKPSPYTKAMDYDKMSPRMRKQVQKYQEQAIEHAKRRAGELARELGLDVEVVEKAADVPAEHRNERGWHDPETGKITVVAEHHLGANDMTRTILSEGVARHGLREMLGENYDHFLGNVLAQLPDNVQQTIGERAESKHGGDVNKATEEYIAEVAENLALGSDKNPANYLVESWASERESAVDLFEDVLFGEAKGDLTDNDLLYLVWKSYNRLRNDAITKAKEFAMRDKLGVGVAEDKGERVKENGQRRSEVARGNQQRAISRTQHQAQHLLTADAKKLFGTTKGEQLTSRDKDGILNAYNQIKDKYSTAIALINVGDRYVMINQDAREMRTIMPHLDDGKPFPDFVAIFGSAL